MNSIKNLIAREVPKDDFETAEDTARVIDALDEGDIDG